MRKCNLGSHHSNIPMMWCLVVMIFCHFIGCATSFQQRHLVLLSHSVSAFRISDHRRDQQQHYYYYDSKTCLFGEKRNNHRAIAWDAKYQELAEFYKNHGHLKVERNGGNGVLYNWIRTQRQKRKGTKGYAPLTEEQTQLLDEIDFPWDGTSFRFESGWHSKYQELAEYYKKHGHSRVGYNGGSLYQWITMQRKKRKGENKGLAPLTEEQIQLLEEIDFPWNPLRAGNSPESREKQWHSKYQELADFYKKHGHSRVGYRYNDGSLYRWIVVQRQKRKGEKGLAPLTEEQIQLLEEIDFPWSHNESEWMTTYHELAEFYRKHGHFRVELRGSLHTWIVTQRKKRNGTARYTPPTEEQIRLLDEIDFPWEPLRKRGWNSRYQELVEFYKKHGHFRVEIGGSLHTWMLFQRRKRNGKIYGGLTDEQIQLLDDINFDWNPVPFESEWMARYQELAEFHKKHGHLNVAQDSSLYYWIVTQRRKRKGVNGRTPLTDEQIELLDEINFAWDPLVRNELGWNAKHQELAEFYKKHGHSRVKGPGSLYQWMGIQRRKRKGMHGLAPLTEDQIQLLDEIEFVWESKRGKKGSG